MNEVGQIVSPRSAEHARRADWSVDTLATGKGSGLTLVTELGVRCVKTPVPMTRLAILPIRTRAFAPLSVERGPAFAIEKAYALS
jgi:hypothetical protein